MGLLPVAAVALLGLVWIGRQGWRKGSAVRIAMMLTAVMTAVGAVVTALRGDWLASMAFVAASAALARWRRPGRRPVAAVKNHLMSIEEARALLGVGPDAGQKEIAEAYRRLIRLTHPDLGGSSPLAAQVNAAFERLKSPLN